MRKIDLVLLEPQVVYLPIPISSCLNLNTIENRYKFKLTNGDIRNKVIVSTRSSGAAMDNTVKKVQYKNIVTASPNNNKLGLFSATGAAIVLCCVGCEIGKQVSNYSLNYYNGGKYPLPQTLLVNNDILL